jgi:hypothetical protein
VQIRTVTEADLEPYWALRLQALRDSPEAFGSAYEEQARRPLAEVRQRLKAQCTLENFILVVIIDGQFTGMTGLFRHDSGKVRHKADIWGAALGLAASLSPRPLPAPASCPVSSKFA